MPTAKDFGSVKESDGGGVLFPEVDVVVHRLCLINPGCINEERLGGRRTRIRPPCGNDEADFMRLMDVSRTLVDFIIL